MDYGTNIKPTDLKLLAVRSPALREDASLEDLREASMSSDGAFFAVVNKHNLPVGVVARIDVLREIEPEKKKGLFGKLKPSDRGRSEGSSPIGQRVLSDPLIIEHGTATDVVMDQVFKRKGDRFDEDVVLVRENGEYFGMISTRAIFRLLYGFLGKHMTELRVQSEKIAFQHRQVVQVRKDLEITNQKLGVARDKALEGERIKGSFLANMSHEIRTPMNGVFGMIDLLSDTELSDEQNDLLSTARSSAETLLRIINDILDFSKIESGHVGIESIPFELTETVQTSVALYGEAASDKEVELSVVFDNVPSRVVGDPHRYQQVLNNLISNAIKFTDEGGVKVSVSSVSTESGEGILTEVADSGIGIPPDRLDSLFKPFTQLDDSTVRKYGGTGLGLSICTSLVELMGGELKCVSTPDVGSTFHFALPFERYHEPGSSSALSVSQRYRCSEKVPIRSDFTGMRVLLVENNVVNQEVARRFLTKLHCETVVAENGLVALQYLQNQSFDCVFMDCQMPVMDGFEATERIRAGEVNENVQNVFISAMTAQAMAGDREKCIGVGMDHYFTKPFGLHDFRKALILSGEKADNLYGSSARI